MNPYRPRPAAPAVPGGVLPGAAGLGLAAGGSLLAFACAACSLLCFALGRFAAWACRDRREREGGWTPGALPVGILMILAGVGAASLALVQSGVVVLRSAGGGP